MSVGVQKRKEERDGGWAGRWHSTEVGEEEHCGSLGLWKVSTTLSTDIPIQPVLGVLGFRADNVCLWGLSLLSCKMGMMIAVLAFLERC